MQLTGGQYKGRKINVPDKVRPTLAVVREGVFNSLFSLFGESDGLKFLDMFLGSGIITLEAASRGYEVTAFEIDSLIIKNAKDNAYGFKNQPKIIKADCMRALLKSEEKFDIIYADPPWTFSYLKVFEVVAKSLNKNGVALIECDKRKKLEVLEQLKTQSTLKLFKEKNYGRCYLLFLELS